MRDGFYGSQLIASLDGAITVVNSSMARQVRLRILIFSRIFSRIFSSLLFPVRL